MYEDRLGNERTGEGGSSFLRGDREPGEGGASLSASVARVVGGPETVRGREGDRGGL